jgi:hypothetical protein
MSFDRTLTSVYHDFRVSRTTNGLLVEVLDYHAGPLHLTSEQLGELGFTPADASESTPHGSAAEVEALANRAIDLLERRLNYETRASAELEQLRARLQRARPSHRGAKEASTPPISS